MTEHDAMLWVVHTTDDERPYFYVLACCLLEAAAKATNHCDRDDNEVLSVELAPGPLMQDDDDEGEPDDVERPLNAKEQEKAESRPRSGSN